MAVQCRWSVAVSLRESATAVDLHRILLLYKVYYVVITINTKCNAAKCCWSAAVPLRESTTAVGLHRITYVLHAANCRWGSLRLQLASPLWSTLHDCDICIVHILLLYKVYCSQVPLGESKAAVCFPPLSVNSNRSLEHHLRRATKIRMVTVWSLAPFPF